MVFVVVGIEADWKCYGFGFGVHGSTKKKKMAHIHGGIGGRNLCVVHITENRTWELLLLKVADDVGRCENLVCVCVYVSGSC